MSLTFLDFAIMAVSLFHCSNGEMFGSLDDVKYYPMARLKHLIMVWNVANTEYLGHLYFDENEVIRNYPAAFDDESNPDIRGNFLIKGGEDNNRFDISLKVGERECKFEETKIHVFKKELISQQRVSYIL